jgi:hypothetical protein
MESYKIFGATGSNDTHHVSSSLSLSNTSTPHRTQSMDTGLQELPYVPHKSWNEGSSIFYYNFFAENVFLAGSPTPATQCLPLFIRRAPGQLLTL